MKYPTSFYIGGAQTKNRISIILRFLDVIAICFLTLVLVSCGGDGNSTGPDPDPDPDPDLNRNVSFSQDISPIFQSSCATSGCHDSGTQESGVNLSSYDDAINSVGNQYEENIINAGNPDESPLVDKIEPDPQEGQRMPYQRDPLSQADIDSIRAWIEDGAPDN
ncbi:c-type cytochrome domain-containing protein [Fodinibius sp.]|uniref:c-type cytochrome domain-containing protein n=1 Tax=Fodinibius sp. TaxID=1872440 RepID=UPI002ACF0183|nr:c-type cytochrome domain-containing protein [Fodinibius sp.]MDZ7660268.1 c-type cytochrome domain-containing protein [Fodinibius sp.]